MYKRKQLIFSPPLPSTIYFRRQLEVSFSWILFTSIYLQVPSRLGYSLALDTCFHLNFLFLIFFVTFTFFILKAPATHKSCSCCWCFYEFVFWGPSCKSLKRGTRGWGPSDVISWLPIKCWLFTILWKMFRSCVSSSPKCETAVLGQQRPAS